MDKYGVEEYQCLRVLGESVAKHCGFSTAKPQWASSPSSEDDLPRGKSHDNRGDFCWYTYIHIPNMVNHVKSCQIMLNHVKSCSVDGIDHNHLSICSMLDQGATLSLLQSFWETNQDIRWTKYIPTNDLEDTLLKIMLSLSHVGALRIQDAPVSLPLADGCPPYLRDGHSQFHKRDWREHCTSLPYSYLVLYFSIYGNTYFVYITVDSLATML